MTKPVFHSVLVLALGSLSPGFAQPVLRAEPAVMTNCTEGELGRTTISWDSGGIAPVQIRLITPAGKPLTGPEGPTGRAETGDWVGDGLTFFLVDAAGSPLAEVRMTVACGEASPLPRPETLESYFPLEVGNRWTFELTGRSVIHSQSGNDTAPGGIEESFTRFLPLYTAPNQPVPPGIYTVTARATLGANRVQEASVPLVVE